MTESEMKILSSVDVHQGLSFQQLVPLLKQSFSSHFSMPQRQILPLCGDERSAESLALLPAWNEEVIATKLFTYFPDNDATAGLHSLYSKIMLFKRTTGEPVALVDGTSVTYWRTAAVSALASQLLSRSSSEQLLLFGTGNLASYLIRAHLQVRPIKKVFIAGRQPCKVAKVIDRVSDEFPDVNFQPAIDINQTVAHVDVICCATRSPTPLFDGAYLQPGTHLDCLGNHHKEHRECDTQSVMKAKVYVDSLANNLAEAGELLIPMAAGEFKQEQIVGELSDMCRGDCELRSNDREITLFKSVGTAFSDLVTANQVLKSKVNLNKYPTAGE